jgi:peptidoglycan hydrolase CwlO-like protein
MTANAALEKTSSITSDLHSQLSATSELLSKDVEALKESVGGVMERYKERDETILEMKKEVESIKALIPKVTSSSFPSLMQCI